MQTKAGGEKTTILEGLQGFFEPGKVTALVSLNVQNFLVDSVSKCVSDGAHAGAPAWRVM